MKEGLQRALIYHECKQSWIPSKAAKSGLVWVQDTFACSPCRNARCQRLLTKPGCFERDLQEPGNVGQEDNDPDSDNKNGSFAKYFNYIINIFTHY